ncbi:hypothetical protein IG631_13753 [Alternaria alternata]|nr:hypothetical protein IG631_13753 [Alternaria alternata]
MRLRPHGSSADSIPHEPAQPLSPWAEEERSRTSRLPIACQCRIDAQQIPQARLVAGWWLVRPASQLESQHGRRRPRPRQHRRHGLDAQRKPRIPRQDARTPPILPQPIVRPALAPLAYACMLTMAQLEQTDQGA